MALGPVGDAQPVQARGDSALTGRVGRQRDVAQATRALREQAEPSARRTEEDRLVGHVVPRVRAQAEDVLVPRDRRRAVVEVEGHVVDANEVHGDSLEPAHGVRDRFDLDQIIRPEWAGGQRLTVAESSPVGSACACSRVIAERRIRDTCIWLTPI
jgi:hypothetical protein